MNKYPVIGVTGPEKGGQFAWTMTWIALKRAGSKPVRITSLTDTDLSQLDGLVLGGGSDIDPGNYGEDLLEIKDSTRYPYFKERLCSTVMYFLRVIFSVKTVQPRKNILRDDMEKQLCHYALEHRLPVLGICRGAQLINIALGGTLHQNTRVFYTETPHLRTLLPLKRIFLTKESKLRKIFGVDTFRVNSLHDQSVKSLGQNIVITATEKNTVVQAIEHIKHPFMIGVQWHPEYLPYIKLQQKLFKALVESSVKLKK